VDWPRLHTGRRPRRLKLPGYPFTPKRHPRRTDFAGAGAFGTGATTPATTSAPAAVPAPATVAAPDSVPAPAAAVDPATGPSVGAPPAGVCSVLPELDAAAAEFLHENPDSTSLAAAARAYQVADEMRLL